MNKKRDRSVSPKVTKPSLAKAVEIVGGVSKLALEVEISQSRLSV